MRAPLTIPGELLSCFSGPFPISGTGGYSFSRVHSRGGPGAGPRERRAVVWPVSWLVRGRAWPGGLTLAWRGRAVPARPLWVRPGPPVLPGEGPAPGRWVKNRTTRHQAPALLSRSAARRGCQVRAAGQHEPDDQLAMPAGAAGWPGIRASTARYSSAAASGAQHQAQPATVPDAGREQPQRPPGSAGAGTRAAGAGAARRRRRGSRRCRGRRRAGRRRPRCVPRGCAVRRRRRRPGCSGPGPRRRGGRGGWRRRWRARRRGRFVVQVGAGGQAEGGRTGCSHGAAPVRRSHRRRGRLRLGPWRGFAAGRGYLGCRAGGGGRGERVSGEGRGRATCT